MKGKKKNILWWIGLLAGLVLINYIAATVHFRLDLTEEKRYSLTPTSREMVRNLSSDVVIDVFLKGDFPSGFRKLSNTTLEFLTVLKETNPGRVKYRFISPDEPAGNGKSWGDSLRSAGIEPINLTVQQTAGQENKYMFPYALLHAGGRTEVVNLFPSSQRSVSPADLNNAEATMEYSFVKSLDKLINQQVKAIAYAVGNGEPVGEEITALRQAVSADYRMLPFDLNKFSYVPKEANVLLIVKPATGFSEHEKLKIDQYIMNGGKVMMFIDNLFAEQDSLVIKSQLVAYDRNLNLGDLLFNYGVRINADLLMDLQCDFLPFAVGGTGDAPQYEFLKWNYFPLFETRNNHPINKNLGLVASRYVNSIDTVEADNIRKTFLLESSVNSRLISTPALISLNENRNTAEDALFKKKGIPVAVLLEGTFNSLYRNRISTAQRDSLAQSGGFKEQITNDGKLIVVSDGDIVLNDVSAKEGPLQMGMNLYTAGSKFQAPVANSNFLLNCLEYLTSKETIISTRNKEIVLRLLDAKKVEAEKGKWQLINIALPVLLVVIFGIVYQRFRRYRFASA
ncbi:MAG TPA: gliding motility-associated ABC transporter substrate-binding protein GldG [Flavisolibacter sp.]|nr:gliding motility-associated ABC transporter substrate-binding protein GldG [Flavisolibacter sp.]